MRPKQVPLVAAAFVLSQVFQLAAASAHNDMADMTMHLDIPAKPTAAPEPPSASSGDLSYFADGSSTSLMVAHAGLMIIAWVFILPVGITFSMTKSRLSLPFQLLFLIVNAVGLFFGFLFNASTPDLYPNNAHHKMGWMATWILAAHFVMGILFAYSRRSKKPAGTSDERTAFLPLSASALAEVGRGMQTEANYRWSGDSGQGTEPTSPSELPNMAEEQRREMFDQLPKPEPDDFASSDDGGYSGQRYLRNSPFDKFLTKRVPALLSKRIARPMKAIYDSIDWLILPFGFIIIVTGGVAYSGICKGNNIFSGLAHFIKGGIFFWYGLLTLGRWMGAFAEFGWAWNLKPGRGEVSQWKTNIKSAEFVESAVIFTYGFTNVWLEHLASWGDAWSAQDLEHVSISIMFFGGGLCGMLVESSKIRDFLNSSVANLPPKANPTEEELQVRLQPKVYKTSMNPMPGLVILLLGLMMSSHHQDSMTSTMVHKQWGTLLIGFAMARAVTYVILYISPPSSLFPSRPPSELVSAFCLISGGLIFMASDKDIVEGMEYYNLDAMFIFTVGMGFTAFLMAWEVVVLAIKGWSVRRASPKFTEISYQE